jgi:hypothetical protein
MVAFDSYYDALHRRFGTPYPCVPYEQSADWPDFVHIGLVCSMRGWDPAEYVDYASGAPSRGTSVMTPHDMASASVMRSFENRPRTDVQPPKDMYRQCVELLVARECGDAGSDERDLLLSPMSAFPAWFRVFYPESIDTGIVDTWGGVAKTELSASPALVEFLEALDTAKWSKLKRLLWGYAPVSEGGAR